MARLDECASLDVLREANQDLRQFLADNAGVAQGNEEEVQTMLQLERSLRAVGGHLDRLQRIEREEVRVELGIYRDNLLRLRQQLGVLQKSALECRARLFLRESHLRTAQAWCASARSIG